MRLHSTKIVVDKHGDGNKLIQWSSICLKEDALHWLRVNGRLPSSTISDYFEEIKQLKKLKHEVKALKVENESYKAGLVSKEREGAQNTEL